MIQTLALVLTLCTDLGTDGACLGGSVHVDSIWPKSRCVLEAVRAHREFLSYQQQDMHLATIVGSDTMYVIGAACWPMPGEKS